MGTQLKPGDIILTRSYTWLGRIIRRFTKDPNEPETRVNHVGIVVGNGTNPRIVEALHKVKYHHLYTGYPPSKKVDIIIYRHSFLTDQERMVIAEEALTFVNVRYGYTKILMLAFDHLLRRRFFRRFIGLRNGPICSYLVAKAYSSINAVIAQTVRPEECTPDDIDDYLYRSSNWKVIHSLGPLHG